MLSAHRAANKTINSYGTRSDHTERTSALSSLSNVVTVVCNRPSVLQGWLAEQKQQIQESSNAAQALVPRTPSLEQAGGLHRMVLRGHTAGISKVLLTPNGTDVVTGTGM